jgi:hypothetical protein
MTTPGNMRAQGVDVEPLPLSNRREVLDFMPEYDKHSAAEEVRI